MEFGTRWKSLSGAIPVLDALGLLGILVVLAILDVLEGLFSGVGVGVETERKSLKVAYFFGSLIKCLGLRPSSQIPAPRGLRVGQYLRQQLQPDLRELSSAYLGSHTARSLHIA
jgi:xanthosine utilization system XapX-like protein